MLNLHMQASAVSRAVAAATDLGPSLLSSSTIQNPLPSAMSSSSVVQSAVASMASSHIPSLRTLGQVVLGAASLAAAASETCSNPAQSCGTSTKATCCYAYPGGQLMQTQFWDTDPETGPTDSWTIHGLWPDHCDGTYDESCDSSRDYTGISTILTNAGMTDLLNYMETYWVNNDGTSEELWEHEWATHGTCINTLDTSCYTDYEKYDELLDFLSRTVSLFKTLDTYTALSNAGITPSSSKTYTSSAIQSALSEIHDGTAVLGCESDGTLYQVYYAFNVIGSVQDGTFVAVDPTGSSSTCPSSGIKYLPKSGSSSGGGGSTTTTSSSPAPTGSFSGKGYLEVASGGCLISTGLWMVDTTCATFTATTSGSGFTLKSSKGSCGFTSGAFSCGSSVSATTFTASSFSSLYAASTPSGETQVTVYSTSTSAHSKSLSVGFSSTS